jgi:D-glycero-alpha-D-manno-heptose-7-phosphate kinase
MIITRTPFRMTLGGGGTDLPSFYREHGGYILAVAIDKYMFLNVNTPIVDDKIRVRYTNTEIVDHVDDVKHTLAREALRHFGVASGVEIVSIADIPAGTGLGSSSSYLVGLLNAMHTLLQDQATPQKLAEEACQIELEVLKKPIGKQDQYMAAFGGLTALDIDPDGHVCVTRLGLDVDLLEDLESNILMFFTNGMKRLGITIERLSKACEKSKISASRLAIRYQRGTCAASESCWTFTGNRRRGCRKEYPARKSMPGMNLPRKMVPSAGRFQAQVVEVSSCSIARKTKPVCAKLCAALDCESSNSASISREARSCLTLCPATADLPTTTVTTITKMDLPSPRPKFLANF